MKNTTNESDYSGAAIVCVHVAKLGFPISDHGLSYSILERRGIHGTGRMLPH